MKVWITKYALTQGILEIEAEITSTSDNMIKELNSKYTTYYHGEGREWHKTLEAAKEKAEQMRITKIASLKKSLAKFEKIKF